MLAPPQTTNKSAIRILAISGSGRKGSYNTALLDAAKTLAPDDAIVETYDVSKFPLFNEDLEGSMPERVREFKQKIDQADAILFATPEYNYTISAVLKNALEWGNRPDNSWDGKPAAIISASSGPRGGARAQLHLRQIMIDLNMHPMNRPLLLVANASEKFDGRFKLSDERTREVLQNLLASLVAWARRINENTVVPYQ